jgi:hypothetical protein
MIASLLVLPQDGNSLILCEMKIDDDDDYSITEEGEMS